MTKNVSTYHLGYQPSYFGIRKKKFNNTKIELSILPGKMTSIFKEEIYYGL